MPGIRLAQITGAAPSSANNYRCWILALDTNSPYLAVCNPSPYMAVLPESNALVYFLDGPCLKRIIGCLHDLDFSQRTIADAATYGEEAIGDDNELLVYNPGDVYVGKYGRALFDKAGNVDVTTFNARAELYMDQDTGRVELSGYDFSLFTKDDGVYIYSEDSTGDGYGDTLHIERSINDGADLVTDLVLDTDGNYDLNVGYTGGAASVTMHMGVTGGYVLANSNGGMTLVAAGTWAIFSGGSAYADALVGLKLDNSGNRLDLKAATVYTTASSQVVLDSPSILLGAGATGLVAIADLVVTLFNAHSHSNGNQGLPTGVPLAQLTAAQVGSAYTKVV